MGTAVGPDHDDAGEAGRRRRWCEVEVVPAQRTEGTTAGAGHDGQLQEQGQTVIHRLGLGGQMDDVDVGRRLDLLLEDLTRLGMVGGVAADPTPLHSLTERGAHHGVTSALPSRRSTARRGRRRFPRSETHRRRPTRPPSGRIVPGRLGSQWPARHASRSASFQSAGPGRGTDAVPRRPDGALAHSPTWAGGYVCAGLDGQRMVRVRTNKAPGQNPGPLTWFFFWHPQRDSNPCRHLERAQASPHGGAWSP
jgi:hypothetical protein